MGTLAARAGNAWDQALLLHALVDANGYDVCFAFGTLGDDAVAALLAAAPMGARVPLDDPAMAEVLAMDVERIGDRARRDHALLIDVLGDRRVATSRSDAARRAAARDRAPAARRSGTRRTRTAPAPPR